MSPMQPGSLLHALPQELRDAIFALVVISPTPLPARILLRDIETPSVETTATDATTSTTPSTQTRTQIRITPPQPTLSLVDRTTRPTVLRIFYQENTFLFRKHAYDNFPTATWLQATINNNYTPFATLIRHVQLETSMRKACTITTGNIAHQQALLLERGPREEHIYRIAISPRTQPKLDSSGHDVSFAADLKKMCSCALRSAGLMFRPSLVLTDATPASFAGVFTAHISSPLQFAADIEDDILLEGPCRWHLCSTTEMTRCKDCGRSILRGEKLGLDLLKWYEKAARRERREAARRSRREAVEAANARRSAQLAAEREAHRVRAAMALQQAQKRVAEAAGEALFGFIVAKGNEAEARRQAGERAAAALREAETRGESSAAGALRESEAAAEAIYEVVKAEAEARRDVGQRANSAMREAETRGEVGAAEALRGAEGVYELMIGEGQGGDAEEEEDEEEDEEDDDEENDEGSDEEDEDESDEEDAKKEHGKPKECVVM